MSYYHTLNLPKNPIKRLPTEVASLDGQILKNPREELTDEVLAVFDNLGIEVGALFYFCKGDKQSSATDRVLHSDLTRADPAPWHMNDAPENKTWKSIICGINWELTGSSTEFSFWDTSNLKGCWPVRHGLPLKYDYLNSVHYVKRGNYGIPSDAIKLDQVVLASQPTLIRTETPHITTYSGPNVRIGASLRFKETWSSWEEAVEKFQPLIAK